MGASVTPTYPMTVATDLRSLSVQDYHRMVEARILAANERVELIEGQLHSRSSFCACWEYGIEQKPYEQDTIAPLVFPDCKLRCGSFCDRTNRGYKSFICYSR
jgi:hypothetical protein